MTITETESGLSSANYTAIQSDTGNLAIQVVAQRYGPVWINHSGNSRTGENFDAVIADTYLVQAYVTPGSAAPTIERLSDQVGGTWTAVSAAAGVSDIDDTVPVSLASNGLAVRLFYYNGTKIRYTECADISSGTFGAPSDVTTVSSVIGLAATSTIFVHYIALDAQNNRRLSYAVYSASWTVTNSDVYWPYPIHGFDAVDIGNKDIIMMASDLPPLIGSRAIAGEVTQEVNRVQGLIVFHMANDRWSDYQMVDVIDLTTDLEMDARASVRLSYINSILFASYLRKGGGGDYPYSHAGVSRSKDGGHWEFVEFVRSTIPMPPFVILPRNDYLWAVGVDRTMYSPCCAWAGQTPVEYDLTNYIIGMEAHAADMRQTNVQVSNPADVLSGTLAKSDDRIQLVYNLGYTINGSPIRMTVSTEDLVSRRENLRLPHQGLSLETLDRLARINRIRSDFAAEWPSLQGDRDNYIDPTGTGYGGLRRSAPIRGSWKAEESTLRLLSDNKEGIAMSTIVADALNGSAQTGFQLTTDDQGEYAGIAFRIFDKDNLWAIVYDLDNDYFKCIQRQGGVDTELHLSNTMSWTINTYYYLKVVVRYAIVSAYYSTDGITWTAITWADAWTGELDGLGDAMGGGEYNVWSGRFGSIGYGYSEEDNWDGWTPDPWVPPIPPDDPIADFPPAAILWNFRQAFRTTNWDEVTPDWTLEVTGLDTNADGLIEPANEIYMLDVDDDNGYAYATTVSGVWRCDMTTAGNTWEQILTIAAAKAGMAFDTNPRLVSLAVHQGIVLVADAHGPDTWSKSSGYAVYNIEAGTWKFGRIEPEIDWWDEYPSACVVPGGCGGNPAWKRHFSCDLAVATSTHYYGDRVYTRNSSGSTRIVSPDCRTVGCHMRELREDMSSCSSSTIVDCACAQNALLGGIIWERLALASLSAGGSLIAVPIDSNTACPGSSGDYYYSVAGLNGEWKLAYYGSTYHPSSPFAASTAYIAYSGPNGFKGHAWIGKTISALKRLVDPYDNVLFIPEDYFGDHNDLGWTEGYPANGLFMCTVCYQSKNRDAGRGYAYWSEDGGLTWADKTAKIRLSIASGGLFTTWQGGATSNGCAFFKKDTVTYT